MAKCQVTWRRVSLLYGTVEPVRYRQETLEAERRRTEVGPPGKGTRQTVRVGLNDVFSVRRALGAQWNILKKERQKLPIQFVQILTNFW